MNKEFVPYEEALVLKELGFDEPCFGHYSKELGLIPMYTASNTIFYKDEGVLAPLYQQAFRWFRDEHNLCGLPTIGNQEFSYRIFDKKSDEMVKGKKITSLGFNYNGTYEEAELACLRKLIEIINQNKDERDIKQ